MTDSRADSLPPINREMPPISAISRLGRLKRQGILSHAPAMIHALRPSLLLTTAVVLTHCGAPRPPQCHRVPLASRGAARDMLASARGEWAILTNSSRRNEWPAARSRYNATVAKLFDQLRCGPDGWDTRAAAIGTRIGSVKDQDVDPRTLNVLFPASLVKGHVVRDHKTTGGVGVPLVGWKHTSPVGRKRDPYLLPNGLPYNVTATLGFSGGGLPEWHFVKRWKHDTTRVGSTTHPLAADWTAANRFYWNMCDLDNLKIQNVLLPDRFNEETGLYFVTPYDPEKIPVVFVHGLVSSPDAFKNIVNELVPEPWFREKYQIWLYNYPTGNPWIYSSMMFREKLREACAYARTKGPDANLDRMVIVSHSMGGLISRSSVTEPGTVLYDGVFKKTMDELQISDENRRTLRDGFLYQPLREPKRVVFMAVPHRGSPMASMQLSMWFSKLIRLPKSVTIELLDTTLLAVSDVFQGEDPSKRIPTSINSLSPTAHTTVALNKLPLPENITFHSIIGDRGRGNTPDSSDGVVPYWSSHVRPVASEKIVPSNHSVPDNRQAAEELKRILKLHLQEQN